ncbi:serine-aspartate repeat-containing protein C-like [Ruditapes philippinarum]|uniref:serine-aspartate repeat-containing protein C-like n=1 Tax=Ruditapes philippinarum TaxID=129788 RepID=UPI00295C11D2|nr:serine-aspartate repeat-containing protein C-like [Ruditapes philippinarum]
MCTYFRLGVYKPLKTKIDDVLCEMKELEEQNIVSPESVLDKDNKSDEYTDVCTASFEADAFLESEEIVMETIRQHQTETETGQNKESTSEDKTDLDMTDMIMINNEITNDVEILADKDTHYVEILADKDTDDVEILADKDTDDVEILADKDTDDVEILADKDTDDVEKLADKDTDDVEILADKDTDDVEKLADKDTDDVEILADKDTDDVEILADKDTHLDKQSVTVEIVTDDTEKETEVLLNKGKTDSEGDSLSQNSSTSQIVKQCQSQDVETKELNTSGCKEMKDEGKHVETDMEPCLDTSEKKDACRSKDIEMSETSGKLQVFRNTVKDGKNLNVFDKAVKEEPVFRQVQVQEISSGKDQSTQTDLELETVKAVNDIGVQCDIPVFPSLASLAGKCYKVKPLKSSVSLKLIDGKDKE